MKLSYSLSVHFIGICGSGMNVLAKYLKRFGFKVSGSDLNCGEVFNSLVEYGIDVKLGHSVKNVEDASIVVYSYSIKEIAELLSYSSPQFFAKEFKKKYGVSPKSIKMRKK